MSGNVVSRTSRGSGDQDQSGSLVSFNNHETVINTSLIAINGFSLDSKNLNCNMTITMITRKQWNRKTTLQQYLGVFDVVANKKVLLDTDLFREMGLFTLHNCNQCLMLIKLFQLKLDSKSRLPISEFSGSHCFSYLVEL